MLGSRGQNRVGGGTVSNCLLFIPQLLWNLDELLYGCLESQYIEACEAPLALHRLPSWDGCHSYCGN